MKTKDTSKKTSRKADSIVKKRKAPTMLPKATCESINVSLNPKSVQWSVDLDYFIKNVALKVDIDPGFQSPERWSRDDRRSYITSLLSGMAVSKFIYADVEECMNSSKNSKDKKYYKNWHCKGIKYLNIDSNNRTLCIKDWLNSKFGMEAVEFSIEDKCGKMYKITIEEGTKFNQLSGDIQDLIKNNICISLEIYKYATRQHLHNIFISVNAGSKLNVDEIRNGILSDSVATMRGIADEHARGENSNLIFDKTFTKNDLNRRKVDGWVTRNTMFVLYGFDDKINCNFLYEVCQPGGNADKNVPKIKKLWNGFKNVLVKNEDIFLDFIGNGVKKKFPVNILGDAFYHYGTECYDIKSPTETREEFRRFLEAVKVLRQDRSENRPLYHCGNDTSHLYDFSGLMKNGEAKRSRKRYEVIVKKMNELNSPKLIRRLTAEEAA